MDRWIGRILFGFVSFAIAMWFAILILRSSGPGYSWREMDWNGDGHTSVGEFLDTGDTFERDVIVHGQRCVEVVAMKDGLPLRTKCPRNSSR
jgi:hypothetical protein